MSPLLPAPVRPITTQSSPGFTWKSTLANSGILPPFDTSSSSPVSELDVSSPSAVAGESQKSSTPLTKIWPADALVLTLPTFGLIKNLACQIQKSSMRTTGRSSGFGAGNITHHASQRNRSFHRRRNHSRQHCERERKVLEQRKRNKCRVCAKDIPESLRKSVEEATDVRLLGGNRRTQHSIVSVAHHVCCKSGNSGCGRHDCP